MRYSKEYTSAITFPMGGIGAGCISLAGNGRLVDWEIFGRPDKGRCNGFSHLAIRAEKDGKVLDIRVLNGDLPPAYTGEPNPPQRYRGFGFGPEEETLCNWPHFREHTFNGTFPVAEVEFDGEASFPGKVALTGWSPFVPGESRDASLPAAFLEVEVENTTDQSIDYTVVGVLGNPWGWEKPNHYNEVKEGQLTAYSGDDTGDVTLTILEDKANISWQTNSFRGQHRDHQEVYYDDMMAGGRFKDRIYPREEAKSCIDFGLLASHITLQPGEKRRVPFVITWNVPARTNDWDGNAQERAQECGVENHWRAYYATQWKDSRDSGKYAQQEYSRMRQGTFAFRDALHASTIPEVIRDGISANLAVLKSPTCLRLEDGTFWGWEGVGNNWGSCPGSCTHVWNYTQAMPFLFPDLERSMRVAHLKYGMDENGGSHFRLMIPLGIQSRTTDFRPCVDGQFGDVMKFYRDWKICGDNDFLKEWWPQLRRLMEYAWSPLNKDKWDPEATGVIHGRQHHTLDMELIGPNMWLTAHYLGALVACAEMGQVAGDVEFAQKCANMAKNGRKWCEENLFNGEYFCHKLAVDDLELLEKFEDAPQWYWNEEHKQIKYQIADGCAIDTPLAQWYATLYGLGELYSPELNRKTLQAIYRHNFKKSMRNEVNLWRVYSLNDEAGTVICTWPNGNRPVIPLTYHSETMTGFEWSFAAQLIHEGMIAEGEEVATAIRQRFNGKKRNPWNEFECGSNYARSMASFGVLYAYSGFKYDQTRGMIGFAPKESAKNTFWSLGDAWGVYCQEDTTGAPAAKLQLLHGTLEVKELQLPFAPKALSINGSAVTLPVIMRANDTLEIHG